MKPYPYFIVLHDCEHADKSGHELRSSKSPLALGQKNDTFMECLADGESGADKRVRGGRVDWLGSIRVQPFSITMIGPLRGVLMLALKF